MKEISSYPHCVSFLFKVSSTLFYLTFKHELTSTDGKPLILRHQQPECWLVFQHQTMVTSFSVIIMGRGCNGNREVTGNLCLRNFNLSVLWTVIIFFMFKKMGNLVLGQWIVFHRTMFFFLVFKEMGNLVLEYWTDFQCSRKWEVSILFQELSGKILSLWWQDVYLFSFHEIQFKPCFLSVKSVKYWLRYAYLIVELLYYCWVTAHGGMKTHQGYVH